MTRLPPSSVYNKEKHDLWFAEHQISQHTPQVSEQVRLIPVDIGRLHVHAYNPSLIRHDGRLLMAYRYHPSESLATSIAIAELGEDFKVKKAQEIGLEGGKSFEDPRLFTHNGELWMAWIHSTWPDNPPKCVVKYGRLKEGSIWKVKEAFQPVYEKNDWSGLEKNFIFFEHDSKLLCIYSTWPEQVIIELDGEKVIDERKTRAPQWPWGAMKGGTAPLPNKGNLLRFFHGTLDNEPPPWHRRYYIGAMLMEPEPPFQIIKLSSAPIIIGSELCSVKPKPCDHYKGRVVFPAGAVEHEDGWLLSLGVNDCACAVVKIEEGDLSL